jgi:hypothetical protein
MRRKFHNYKKEYGGSQASLVKLYFLRGKDTDEIVQLLKCPRASVRGRISEVKNADHEKS